MHTRKSWAAVAALAAGLSGCAHYRFVYKPHDPGLRRDLGIMVQVGEIENALGLKDPRKVDDNVTLDRPVADAVREALGSELEQAGYSLGESDLSIGGRVDLLDFWTFAMQFRIDSVREGRRLFSRRYELKCHPGSIFDQEGWMRCLQDLLLQFVNDRQAQGALARSKTNKAIVAAGDDELAGDAAAKAGLSLEAIKHYGAALQRLGGLPEESDGLRAKILEQVAVGQAPPVPEEAERRFARAMAILKTAADQDDYRRAIEEMQRAVDAAPWLPEAYYNLGLIRGKAGDPKGAIRALKLYLAGAPRSANAQAVRQRIYELEVQAERER